MTKKKVDNQPKNYTIEITVDSVKRKCPLGIKKGDRWLIDSGFTPSNFCLNAFCNVLPVLRTFRYGGIHPWDLKGNFGKDITFVACPDFINQVIYKLRRFPLDDEQINKKP